MGRKMDILLENVSKEYKDGSKILKALNNINLNIKEHEFIGIIGPSGSGKSTLLNIIGTIDKKFNGSYRLNDIDIKDKGIKLNKIRNKYFGYVFQNFALINNISVYENVKLPLEYSTLNKYEIKERVQEVLNKIGLMDRSKSLPIDMSGGECQKVAMARAIINEPSVILADEPTGSLDKESKKVVIRILCDLYNSGKTIILVTHDLKLIKYCNRVVEIEDGFIKNDYIKERQNYEE